MYIYIIYLLFFCNHGIHLALKQKNKKKSVTLGRDKLSGHCYSTIAHKIQTLSVFKYLSYGASTNQPLQNLAVNMNLPQSLPKRRRYNRSIEDVDNPFLDNNYMTKE